MTASPLVWTITVVAIGALLLFDFVFHVRKAHTPTLREAVTWSALYVGIAVLFGVGVLVLGGTEAGSEYFAGTSPRRRSRSTTSSCSSSS
jgi:tellurite resistance protein TerC